MQKIKNISQLGTTALRRSALLVAEAGLEAIDTGLVLEKQIKNFGDSFSVAGFPFKKDSKQKIYVVAIGKCSSVAALKIEEILGDWITGGIVLDVREPEVIGKRLKYCWGTHPFPSEKNVSVAGEITELLKTLQKEDLVIFVISGGGSTLLCLPGDNNTCVEEELILKQLFAVGANIQEINTIRKHISYARGGYLAKYAYPARAISLIFSDVPGNDLNFIASGPTVLDNTTIEDAGKILTKYKILESCKLTGCGLIETPKEEKFFENVSNILIVSNAIALEAMQKRAMELNLSAKIVTDELSGEAKNVAEMIAGEIRKSPKATILLYGGETTVTVDKKGRGGRNGELALSALRFVGEGELIMPVASDGRDNGEYAGAIADSDTRKKAENFGLNIDEYLANHDPASFFEQTGDYLMTGDTGSNVSDLIVVIKE